MDQIIAGSELAFKADRDDSFKQQIRSNSASGVSEKENGFSDCNICLDSAHEPVVTLCGHLYCWPCIYKWLHAQKPTNADQLQQNCPVCKANITTSSLVPLYCSGMSSSEFGSKKFELGMDIPPRPHPSGLNNTLNPREQLGQSVLYPRSQSINQEQYFSHSHGSYTAVASTTNLRSEIESLCNSRDGMFGEMVYARLFGMDDATLFAYPYRTTYHFIGNNRPRMRRQEKRLYKSLNRVSIFLVCFIILCLLSF